MFVSDRTAPLAKVGDNSYILGKNGAGNSTTTDIIRDLELFIT
jgi:hypothetical protein